MTFAEQVAALTEGLRDVIDLGDEHYLMPIIARPAALAHDESVEPRVVQYIIYHRVDGIGMYSAAPDVSGGTINVDPTRPDSPCWTVVQGAPLTLHPSVHDVGSGDHGWVRDGKWIRA